MPARWTHDRPMLRQEFDGRFPDEEACSRWECRECGRQTSVTAGTLMHRSHLPLRTWFMAAHIVASHSNGISAIRRD